jgi:hypothetical protein
MSQKKAVPESSPRKKQNGNNQNAHNMTLKKSDLVLGNKKESIINDRDSKLNQRDA